MRWNCGIPGPHRILRSLFLLLLLAWAGCGESDSNSGTVSLNSVTAAPGQSADVCVSLSGSHGKVDGIQMDLSWNPACASVNLSSGNKAMCTANPATGKNVSTVVIGSMLRALMFSILNMSPLPDAQLFCCSFTLANAPSDRCCTIGINDVRGSDAVGHAITFAAFPGRICAVPASTASAANAVAFLPPKASRGDL